MSLLLQQLLVGVLVLACALFSAWRLATVGVRLKLLNAVARLPGVGARVGWLERLRQQTLVRQLSACGGCAKAPTPAAASPNQTPGAPRR